MRKFLRIINGEEYLEYLKSEGIYKYIPKKVLYALGKNIDARVICSYISRNTDEEVGLGVGLYLNQDNISKDEYKAKIIETISNLKQQEEYKDVEYLIDDNLKTNMDILKDIKESVDIKNLSGKKVFSKNILSCLKKICEIRNEELSEKEVFIISDDTKVTEDLINDLALSTKFISIYSQDKKLTDRLERDILNETGLALNITKDIGRCSDNFDFIINLNEEINSDILNIKRNNIVFDLSNSKCLSSRVSKKTRKIILIDDLFFKNDNDIYSDSGKNEFNDLLNTSLSDMLNNTNDNIEKIQIYGKVLDIKSGINLENLEKQDVSCFKKTE